MGAGEFKQRGSGAEVVPLQMHERSGQLNQAFVKRAVRAVLVMEPQMFQHLMGFVEKLFIKAMEKAEVMRIELFVIESLDHRGNTFALAAHEIKLKSKVQSLKSKVVAPFSTLDIGLVILNSV